MFIKLKFCFFRTYFLVLIIAILLIIFFATSLPPSKELSQNIVSAAGAIISLFYFIQKQKLEELRLFKELFKEFNERYSRLNGKLLNIATSNSIVITKEEQETLVEYFNLCAEEYFYYRKGYIDPTVWQAWQNGMKALLLIPRIENAWKKECETNSYYGLRIA